MCWSFHDHFYCLSHNCVFVYLSSQLLTAFLCIKYCNDNLLQFVFYQVLRKWHTSNRNFGRSITYLLSFQNDHPLSVFAESIFARQIFSQLENCPKLHSGAYSIQCLVHVLHQFGVNLLYIFMYKFIVKTWPYLITNPKFTDR